MVSLSRLYYFQRIAETGSIRKASEELFVSESALSKSLRLLEREMECELFARHGKRLQLNSNGAFLLELVNDFLEQAGEIKPKLDKHRQVRTRIVIDTYFDFPVNIMLHGILGAGHPDVQFNSLHEMRAPQEHLHDMMERTTDIAVLAIPLDDVQRMMPQLTRQGVNAVFLLMDQLYLSAPLGTELDDVEAAGISDVLNVKLIKPEGNNYAMLWYEEILASRRQTQQYQYSLSSSIFLKDWPTAPNPFISTAMYIARRDYISGFSKRHQVRLTDPEAQRGVFLFYPSESDSIIDLFASMLKQQFFELFEVDEKADD